jgi:hypothetical protein
MWALNYPQTNPQTQDWLFWCSGVVSIGISLAATLVGGEFSDTVVPVLQCVDGVCTWVAAICFAMAWPDSYLGKDGFYLITNVTGEFPMVLKPIKIGDPVGAVVLAVVDGIGDTGAAALTFAEHLGVGSGDSPKPAMPPASAPRAPRRVPASATSTS